MNSLLLLFLSLNSSASLDCANVDLNQLSDDKISEYTHCLEDVEVTISEVPKAKNKFKFTPVCDRSEPVKLKLEEIFNNSCEQISKDMILAYDSKFIMTRQIYHKPKPGDFSGMNNLKHLHLVSNNIKTLPNGLFDDLENLQVLTLSWNQIEELPSNIFDELLKLNNLSINRNSIKTLPIGIFDALKFLKILNIGFNDIKVILRPIITVPDNSLDTLRLYGNPLNHIYNPVFKNLSKLRKLNLNQSNLSIIGKRVFTPLENLQELNLGDINTNNKLISKKTNESTISLDDLSIAQFTRREPFPLNIVGIYKSDSLIRNLNFINQLKEKGVRVVD